MTLKELSEKIKIPLKTIYGYVYGGKIPAYKVGNRWHVDEFSLSKITHIRVCPECREIFATLLSRQKFCKEKHQKSFNQRRRHRRKNPEILVHCLFCGKEFSTARSFQRFCTENHRRKYYRRMKDESLSAGGRPGQTVAPDNKRPT